MRADLERAARDVPRARRRLRARDDAVVAGRDDEPDRRARRGRDRARRGDGAAATSSNGWTGAGPAADAAVGDPRAARRHRRRPGAGRGVARGPRPRRPRRGQIFVRAVGRAAGLAGRRPRRAPPRRPPRRSHGWSAVRAERPEQGHAQAMVESLQARSRWRTATSSGATAFAERAIATAVGDRGHADRRDGRRRRGDGARPGGRRRGGRDDARRRRGAAGRRGSGSPEIAGWRRHFVIRPMSAPARSRVTTRSQSFTPGGCRRAGRAGRRRPVVRPSSRASRARRWRPGRR